MRDRWSDAGAAQAIASHAEAGIGPDLALRVYSTRLLGQVPELVLHGGGNTSVKTRLPDLSGNMAEVLCVKGSGWDMASIEAPGLPAVRLGPLRGLRRLPSLSDEDMVNFQRTNLLDAASPNPSVETLLHAFLPHRYIDHTHANAVLALTDQPDGEAVCREVFGGRVALVPYIMPGFALAKRVAEIHEAHPDCEGMILLKHGVISFAETAEGAYRRMIGIVATAEAFLDGTPCRGFRPAELPADVADAAAVAPILRGLLSGPGTGGGVRGRFVLEHRGGAAVRNFVDGAEAARYGLAGPVTPDHSIRTKPRPVLVPAPDGGDLAGFAEGAAEAVRRFEADYAAYFARGNARAGMSKTSLDPAPRVILVPGVGLFAAGESRRAAGIAADLAEAAISVIGDAERIGRFVSIGEDEVFDIEYWSLEQAKLGKGREPALARHVAVVTGAAGAIGGAVTAAFREQGAEVVGLDRAEGDGVLACDVTDPRAVEAAFDRVAESLGGVDIVVSNAGAAWRGRIGEVADGLLRESFELNFFAHQHVARAAVRIMLAQGIGGTLLFNASKQAVNPGRDFGPYGLPKAATLALMRQYAVDYGPDGITSNAVNADRIRSGLLTDGMIRDRARARGVGEEEYMGGNLLGREVRAGDVAKAFVDLALSRRTTGAVLTVDGGNIAAAMR